MKTKKRIVCRLCVKEEVADEKTLCQRCELIVTIGKIAAKRGIVQRFHINERMDDCGFVDRIEAYDPMIKFSNPISPPPKAIGWGSTWFLPINKNHAECMELEKEWEKLGKQ